MTDFLKAMDTLAAEIAKASCDAGTSDVNKVALADKIDAFKALMPYYAFLKKNKGNDAEENTDLPNFDNFTREIHAKEQGNGSDEPGVSDRPRRNGN